MPSADQTEEHWAENKNKTNEKLEEMHPGWTVNYNKGNPHPSRGAPEQGKVNSITMSKDGEKDIKYHDTHENKLVEGKEYSKEKRKAKKNEEAQAAQAEKHAQGKGSKHPKYKF